MRIDCSIMKQSLLQKKECGMTMKKSRKNCFFGVHFDFHAMPSEVVARDVDYESITQMLDEVKPEYVQIDTKGHPGLSSYPTEVGNRAFEIKADMLKFWREETKKRDILLFAHHSGLFDIEVARLHPEWAVVSEDGEVSKNFISVFSPYAEEFLIPQLEELAGKYQLDGAWIDGDCWAAYVDYGPWAKKAWFEKTGKKLPSKNDVDFAEYCRFGRETFEKYVEKYVFAIKSKYPDFEITSNWIYSHIMPEKPKEIVDFLSGDYACYDSVNNARVVGRCMASAGMPWDLMSWGQNAKRCSWDEVDRTVKEAQQYCQEAAVTISLGGGFEFFNIIYGGGGTVQKWAIPRWREVADFCKNRKDVCYKSEVLPEIAVLYNKEYVNDNMFFGRGKYFKGVDGWINALQNCQYSTRIVYEHQPEQFKKYKVIVVPSADVLAEATKAELSAFAKNGGKLIVEGKSAQFFEDISGITMNEELNDKLIFADGGSSFASIRTAYYKLSAHNNTAKQYCYDWSYYSAEKNDGGFVSDYGKGKIYTLAFDLGNVYTNNVSTALNDYIRTMINCIEFKPIAEVIGSSYIDVTVAEKSGDLLVNLVNMAGSHDNINVRSFSEVPCLCGLKLKIALERKPKEVLLQPENKKIDFTYSNNEIIVEVKKLHIHTVVQVKM